MQVAQGSYVGNGVDNRGITGVGFQPDWVMIKIDQSVYFPVHRTSTMVGDVSALETSATLQADMIQSLDADGFTVGTGTNVNVNTVGYDWVAVRASNADFKVGTYTGNGSDSRGITGVGFLPALVMIFAVKSEFYVWRTVQHAGDLSSNFGFAGTAADLIQSLDADGFTIGTHTRVNANTFAYHYVAFKSVAGFFSTGSYTGNGLDNRSITGAGFQPAFVHVARSATSTPRFKMASFVGEETANYTATAPDATDFIQAFGADGFTVGTNAAVNADTETFRWFAIKAGDSPAPPVGGGSTGGKGKGKSKGGGTGSPQPPGKLKTFGTGHWHYGQNRWWH